MKKNPKENQMTATTNHEYFEEKNNDFLNNDINQRIKLIEILKNKFISEFAIIDYYITDLLQNCKDLLKNNRKYFQSSSNYFRYKKFREEKAAEINKILIQEEKFNFLKFYF